MNDESSVESSLWLSLSLSLTGSASAANLQSMAPDTRQYGFYLCESRCDSVINIILGPIVMILQLLLLLLMAHDVNSTRDDDDEYFGSIQASLSGVPTLYLFTSSLFNNNNNNNTASTYFK